LADVSIGLIGAGRIGRVHAATVSTRIPNARLAAIADVDANAASSLARENSIPKVFTSYEDLIDDSSVEAVIIASATDTHAAIISAAASAGKHIFCEKPIALDLDEIDAAIAAVYRAGVKLQIGFNRRFDADFIRVREALSSGEIGVPHLLHIISRDPAPPPLDYIRVSGGIFLDMTIHDFDMARFLMGCEVTEVYASGAVLVDPAIGREGDIDTALVLLKFETGALGVIDNSRQAVYGYDQRVEVLGSTGSIRVKNRHPNTAEVSTAECVRRDLPLHFFLERYAESYAKELAGFVDAVLFDRQVPVTGADGRIPVVMAQAAALSRRENRPVRLAEIT
jgi:myo-inositol 2-dehydrogenase / D-chiro-inositol 1-dehydrogenase